MKKFSSSLLLLSTSIIILTINSSCNNDKSKPSATVNTGGATTGKIAYINVDSLQEKYAFWKTEAEALAAEQAKIESELQRSAQQLQNDAAAFQQKAQSGNLSEAEGRAAQQRLGQMQQSLETRRTTLGEQLQAKQIAFSEKLQKNIDEYLAIYNKDNKYDYIMSYTKSGQILYANKALDITEDVLKGLNEFKPSATDTSKSK
jgi:outer membrane protein